MIAVSAAFTLGLLFLQWRESGPADLSWLLWHICFQALLIYWLAGMTLARERRAWVPLAISMAGALVSMLFFGGVRRGDALCIEMIVLLCAAAAGWTATSLRATRVVTWPALAIPLAALAWAIFSRPDGFVSYLTPLPAALEVLSWNSNLGHDSAVQIAVPGVLVTRMHLTLLFQAAAAIAARGLRYFSPVRDAGARS